MIGKEKKLNGLTFDVRLKIVGGGGGEGKKVPLHIALTSFEWFSPVL